MPPVTIDVALAEQAAAVEQAAAAAQEAAKRNKDDWLNKKNAMIDWLKRNVGDNVDSNISHLRDVVLVDARNAYDLSAKYLAEARTHLGFLVEDPSIVVKTTDGPRGDDNTTKELPDVSKVVDMVEDLLLD